MSPAARLATSAEPERSARGLRGAEAGDPAPKGGASKSAAPRALKVYYVTMQFPVPSQTFAAVEVRALRRSGADVSVHAMLFSPRERDRLLEERGLAELRCSHNSAVASLRGILAAAARPRALFALLGLIGRACRGSPGHIVRSAALIPRTFDLLRMVGRERPDVVHLFWGHYPSLLGLLLHRTTCPSLVSMFLGAYDLERKYGCSAVLAREAPVVWTHAFANVPALLGLGVSRERIKVAHRGIELSEDSPGAGTKNRYSVLVAERLIPEKMTEDALRVFGRVQGRFPRATMVVLGDGPQRRRLERMAVEMGIANQVTFAGHVSHDEVLKHMNRAEILLSMSRNPSERLPNAVKEAMYYRCACVVADSVGLSELITQGKHGWIVPQGGVEAAADRIGELFADPEQREAMAAAAHDHVVDCFNVDAVACRRIETWRSLLGQQLS